MQEMEYIGQNISLLAFHLYDLWDSLGDPWTSPKMSHEIT